MPFGGSLPSSAVDGRWTSLHFPRWSLDLDAVAQEQLANAQLHAQM